jgi:hypothetical protein
MQFPIAKFLKLSFCAPALAGVFIFCLLLGGVFPLDEARALTINPRLELNANPGTTIRTEIKVTNDERQSRTFFLGYENFNSQDETGTPTFSPRREDLATWIKTPPSITLGPGETIDLPVEIAVPQDAEPGGHFAAVFFLSEPPPAGDDSGKVGIGAKLGSLILLRVNGNFVQNATILEFNTTGKKRIFTQLPIEFFYRFQNTGDDHQKPLGDILIKNIFGQTTKILTANTIDGSVLPKSIRRFTSVWTESGGPLKQEPVVELKAVPHATYWQAVRQQWHHFAFGRYTAKLKVIYGTKELKSAHSEFVFYIIPWQLLSLLVPSAIILLLLARFGIKRYNRFIVQRAKNRS